MRTVVEKMQRLNQIREVYAEQIKKLGEQQIAIRVKLIKEYKLERDWEHRDYLNYDWIEVDCEGYVQLWERGRCGDSDSVMSSFSIDPLIANGDLQGYENKLRVSFQAEAEQAIVEKQKQTKTERERLEKELSRINGEIAKLGEQL